MEVKDLAPLALIAVGSVYAASLLKGCASEKNSASDRTYTPPQPAPICQKVEKPSNCYEECYKEERVQEFENKSLKITRHRKTITTVKTTIDSIDSRE